ncbi:MAG: hypothetical protein II600_01445, partial [Bacteroidaceae bacterium]|nr:hypothetical protein [Bacteroidaceae bacterium]
MQTYIFFSKYHAPEAKKYGYPTKLSCLLATVAKEKRGVSLPFGPFSPFGVTLPKERIHPPENFFSEKTYKPTLGA